MTNLISRWEDIPWAKVEVKVFRLQKQIYSASRCGDVKRVRQLQKLLRMSWSAKALAVRRVTQDNQGKNTAGVDGVKSLAPSQRFELISNLKINGKANPLRRVWIAKPGKKEKRPLGIPTIVERAKQALLLLVLEPEWEARFEPNSYGFRAGRCAQDAIAHIKNAIQTKAKFVLDADISKCFERINHSKLLEKLALQGKVRQQIKAWLTSGVLDNRVFEVTQQGTPQGAVISPLLANIALDGIEKVLEEYALTLNHLRFPCGVKYSRKDKIKSLTYIRYADDFVVIHEEQAVVENCKRLIAEWLATWGLELKPSKTRITHTLKANWSSDAQAGFDFLGFHIRQYSRGKHKSDFNTNPNQPEPLGFDTLITPTKKNIKLHYDKLAAIIDSHRHKSQGQLIEKLNPVIQGWTNYYRFSDVKTTGILSNLKNLVYGKLRSWGRSKTGSLNAAHQKYWRLQGKDNWVFSTEGENPFQLMKHTEVQCSSISYRKVKGDSSPYNGKAVYWSQRRGKYPETPMRIAKLLKWQQGKCNFCELHFREEDVLEIDHIIPKAIGGKDIYDNLQLLHRHCHDKKTRDDIILINSYNRKRFWHKLHKEWDKVHLIWVDDYPVISRKLR